MLTEADVPRFELDGEEFVPDIVVVNAATNPVYGPLLELELEAWYRVDR